MLEILAQIYPRLAPVDNLSSLDPFIYGDGRKNAANDPLSNIQRVEATWIWFVDFQMFRHPFHVADKAVTTNKN